MGQQAPFRRNGIVHIGNASQYHAYTKRLPSNRFLLAILNEYVRAMPDYLFFSNLPWFGGLRKRNIAHHFELQRFIETSGNLRDQIQCKSKYFFSILSAASTPTARVDSNHAS